MAGDIKNCFYVGTLSGKIKEPLEITYRSVEKQRRWMPSLEKKVENLEKVWSYLNSCRIAGEKPQHDRAGNPYRVRINMTVPPGHELAVTRNPGEGDSPELPQVIRKAFEAARRQLKTLVAKQRGAVKTHPEQESVGYVTKLFANGGYGFLQRPDGREIYFHEHSVLQSDFPRLEIGTGGAVCRRERGRGSSSQYGSNCR